MCGSQSHESTNIFQVMTGVVNTNIGGKTNFDIKPGRCDNKIVGESL